MKISERLIHILFPNRCCVCRGIIKPGELLCGDCGQYKAYISKTYTCEICKTDKRQCNHKRLLIEQLAPAFFYVGPVRGAVARLKFHEKPGLAKPFARCMLQSMRVRNFPTDFDCVTCIPMTAKSLRRRGYNQGELIARDISQLTDIPFEPLLVKLRETTAQHKLPRLMRHGSLLGAFEVMPEMEKLVEGKKILIADDVFTSGQTMNEAAKTLLIFGAESIYCTSFAMTIYKKKEKKKEKRSI